MFCIAWLHPIYDEDESEVKRKTIYRVIGYFFCYDTFCYDIKTLITNFLN